MFERIRCMMAKEFIQVLRDPRMRVIIFFVPIIQLMLYGYAVSTDVKHAALVVMDFDNSVESRDFITRFPQSGYFDIIEFTTDPIRAQHLIDTSQAVMMLRLNADFGANILAGRSAEVQMLLDGSDSNTARIVADYAGSIAQRYTRERLSKIYLRLLGRDAKEPIMLETRAWFNENLESRNYYVPGIIAALVALVSLTLTSMAIVREREIGTMEQIIASPITRAEFILGKTIPFALIGYLDVILITVAGMYWFDVPMRGSLPLLFLSVTLFLLSTSGVGLLISTISSTQQQAMMSTTFFFMPWMLLSGFIFPIENMPRVVQWMTYANPLRYMLIIVRGIFLKGVGFDILWPQLLGLLALGVLTLAYAVKRFHKSLS